MTKGLELKQEYICDYQIPPADTGADIETTRRLDRILLNRYLGFPIMVSFFALLFIASFTLGKPVSTWLGTLLDHLAIWFEASGLGRTMPPLLLGLISDGVLRGIGSAVAFFPQMLLFFAFYTLVSDTGYDARIAHLMRRPMSRLNMEGNTFAPLILGYSCNVPAIISANTIPRRSDRLIVMLVTTFVPCSARIGVILYLAAAFFSPLVATLVMTGLIVLSWLVSALIAAALKWKYPGKPHRSVQIKLPPYRFPSPEKIAKSAFMRTLDFLNRIKTVVIVSSVLVWLLSTFPLGSGFDHSFAAMIGQALEPVGRLAGLDWRLIVALFFGFFAKESTLSTLGVLYHASNGLGDLGSILTANIAVPAGLAFLVTYMFYIPCLATLSTIRRETGSRLFTAFTVAVSLSVAFLLGVLAFQISSLALG